MKKLLQIESTIDSEGFKGGTRGTPIMPRDAVSQTANVERWEQMGQQRLLYSYEFVVTFSFPTKLQLSGGKILVKYVIFCGNYLTNFPLAK